MGIHDGGLLPVIGLLVVGGLFVPLAEEMVFRGAMFAGLRRRMAFSWAALLSAALFGAVHTSLFIPAALMGMVLAWTVERERSIHIAVYLHVINNMASLLVRLTQG